MVERHLDHPGAVGLPFHRMDGWIPFIEVAHERNFSGLERGTNKIDRLGHLFGRVTMQGGGNLWTSAMHVLLSVVLT